MGGLITRLLVLILEMFLSGFFFGIGREAGTDAYRSRQASAPQTDEVPEPEEIDIELD